MRRTRWDQKPEIEEPVASGSRWNNQCNPVDWECPNQAQDQISGDREHLDTPHPLDYSSDSRQREQKNASSIVSKDKSESILTKNAPESVENRSSLLPNPWTYTGVPNLPHIYPGSSQNTQMPYPPHPPWNQMQQNFYSNGEFHTDQIFDMKWWEDQRESAGTHLGMIDGRSNKEIQKFDPSRPPPWSFGGRVLKSNERGFDFSRRFTKFQSGIYDRGNKLYRDIRNFSQHSNYNKYSAYRIDRRPFASERDLHHSKLWSRYREYPDHIKPQDYPQGYRAKSNIGGNINLNGGFSKKFKSPTKYPSKLKHWKNDSSKGDKLQLHRRKTKEKKQDSAAEVAKRKALAAAASKLKQTFLAGKQNIDKKANKKLKDSVKQTKKSSEGSSRKSRVQDLSVPKSIPKEGTSLEHDIDIKFSASEWASVGRGEGGTQDVLDLPDIGSKSEDGNSDSESLQTVYDVESCKGSSDNESDNSELTSEEENDDDVTSWHSRQNSLAPHRRRHVSETVVLETEPHNKHTRGRRVRSYSTSQVEQVSPVKGFAGTTLTSNLKNMLVRQLLTMDKKSLKELVNDPKSRKAQFMMSHFMKMHRNVLSQKLNQLRFKNISSSSGMDDLNIFHSLNSSHLETLPSEIFAQVKEILDIEASGKVQQMWEEVSLSLSDLVSGFERADNSGMKSILLDDSDESDSPHHQPSLPPPPPPPPNPPPSHPAPHPPPLPPPPPPPPPPPQHHQHAPKPDKHFKTPTISPQENGNEDPDCQIVTPPPKQPATTITIPDSDNEIPSDSLQEGVDQPINCSSVTINASLDKNISSHKSSPHSRSSIIKPQDLIRTSPPISHPDRPPNPLPHSPLRHLMSPPRSVKPSPNPTPAESHQRPPMDHHSPSFLPPTPLLEAKRIKLVIKHKIPVGSALTSNREECNATLQSPPPSIKVKQERPSPMMECGLCMHPPRSPHTTQCGFAFGIPPPPVALMTGSPRPLGAVPPQRPVQHLASSTLPSIFKQERPAGSYLNLEHINRPSSEERPKNPAPPDAANSEPPSPLPIPPPQSSLHPPPPTRPLIFSDEQFTEPPRPPSPPPPQHSPRIKVERQTPQFICCCMRNECERSNSSRQSADFRRGSATPQGQLCESATMRATPHSVYKFEHPYLSSLRPRTPHNGIVSMFPHVSPAARCLAPPNGSVLSGLLSSQCLNLVPDDASHPSHSDKVNVAVQTERAGSKHFTSSLSLVRSETPISAKIDQTTSTEDLGGSRGSSSEEAEANEADERKTPQSESKGTWDKVSTSASSNGNAAGIMKRVKNMRASEDFVSQLGELEDNEREVLRCLEIVDKKDRELIRERKKLIETLRRIGDIRRQRLCQPEPVVASSSSGVLNGDQTPQELFQHQEEEERMVSNSAKNAVLESHYMVSSSQEVSSLRLKSPDSPSSQFHYYGNDSQPNSIQGERCTSTSLLDGESNALFPDRKNVSDSDEGGPTDHLDRQAHYRVENTHYTSCNGLNLGSLSEDSQEEKAKAKSSSCSDPGDRKAACGEIALKEESVMADSSQLKLEKEGEDRKEEEMDFCPQGPSHIKDEHGHICSLSSNRKSSLSGSPQSPKMRNSSGSEHGYSLRSRGPPNDLFDFNSDSQISKDTLPSNQEDHVDISEDKQPQTFDKHDNDQADDELDKKEELDMRSSSSRLTSVSSEVFKRRKRKRKTKYQISKCRKKKEISGIFVGGKETGHCSPSDALEVKHEAIPKGEERFLTLQEDVKLPPPHVDAVLDLKVVGNLIFTTSTDGTARLFDPVSGVILSTYQNHTNSVTAIQVVGEPKFSIGSPRFQVITGSEDSFIHVYDGKTGVLTQKKNCTEPVRCLDYRWGYLFIGTDGGCGLKWNLKDKKLGEKIQFCGKGITRLLTHVEGGRKVLVVGAKTTPIMIRDAMSGLFLRTLEYVQTMYAAVFHGNLLYTAGSDKSVYVYDYCGGVVKGQFSADAAISGLILLDNYLVAACYDGLVRIFKLPKGELMHAIPVASSHKMFICSALFRNKILLGNKNGEIVCCELPSLGE